MKDTKRRLKENLLISTVTPFMADQQHYYGNKSHTSNVRVQEGTSRSKSTDK